MAANLGTGLAVGAAQGYVDTKSEHDNAVFMKYFQYPEDTEVKFKSNAKKTECHRESPKKSYEELQDWWRSQGYIYNTLLLNKDQLTNTFTCTAKDYRSQHAEIIGLRIDAKHQTLGAMTVFPVIDIGVVEILLLQQNYGSAENFERDLNAQRALLEERIKSWRGAYEKEHQCSKNNSVRACRNLDEAIELIKANLVRHQAQERRNGPRLQPSS